MTNLHAKPSDAASTHAGNALFLRHLRFGWWALLLFLTLGLGLEAMHGFKVDFYLNAGNETRRLLWTLAHAHGTLLALINIVFALTLRLWPGPESAGGGAIHLASRCLIGAAVLLPAGFLLGGVKIYSGDPSLAVLLVPLGAVLLVLGVLLVASARRT